MKKASLIIPFLIIALISSVVLSSCNQIKDKPLTVEMIFGKWTGGFQSVVEVEINSDSLWWSIGEGRSLSQAYQYKISGDSIFLFSEKGLLPKLLLMPNSDEMICCNYKGYIDSNRIDEVVLLERKSKKHLATEERSRNHKEQDFKKDIIIIPENQIGIFLIAFSQEAGHEVNLDKEGNRIFTFDKGTSVFFSQAKEDIRKLAYNNYEVYLQNEDGSLTLFPMMSKLKLDTDKAGDGLLVIIEGFNQGPRKRLNILLDRDISGNVFWFNIGSEAAISNIYDSTMYNGRYYTANHSGISK